MKIGFIFECGPEGPDVQVCRYLVQMLDPAIEFVPSTLDNKKKLVEDCGAVAKVLLNECEKVIIVWDLYPAWRERGMRPCRHEDRQAIFRSLQAENVDLSKVFPVCIQEELEAQKSQNNTYQNFQPRTWGRSPICGLSACNFDCQENFQF